MLDIGFQSVNGTHLFLHLMLSTYMLCSAGDNALLQSVGLLLKVFSCLMVPQQIVFNLEKIKKID